MRYRVVLADPPWKYGDKQTNRKANYRRMTLREIRQMGVGSIVARDAALLLWATAPLLPEAVSVMGAWGFTYTTVGFVWVKTRKKPKEPGEKHPVRGMGHYTRSNAELCLLGIRGRGVRVVSHSVGQVILEPRREHSAKPACVRDRIVQLFGDVPRVELFARGEVPEGWDAWGDEAVNPVRLAL